MKKSKFYLVGLTLFLMVIGMNLQYALNDYGMLSLRFNPEILATGTGGSGTTEPNYAYAAKLTAEECNITVINGEFTIFYNGIEIGPGLAYEHKGTQVNCNFWLLAKCDQNKIVECHIID